MRKAAALGLAAGTAPPPHPQLQLQLGVPKRGGGASSQLPSSSSSTAPLSSLSRAAADATSEARSRLLLHKNVNSTGKLVLAEERAEYDFKAEDLTDLGEIGRGAFGTVNKMRFTKDNFKKVRRLHPSCDCCQLYFSVL